MAKIRLSLDAAPTFNAPVKVPVPGGGTTPVQFTFKGRTKSDFQTFIDTLKGRDDIDVLMDIACGWELSDPFDKDHVEKMLENYIGSGLAVIQTYIAELTGARLGN